MKTLISLFIVASAGQVWAQCGHQVVNPTTGRLDCIGPGGTGGGLPAGSVVTGPNLSLPGTLSVSGTVTTAGLAVNAASSATDGATLGPELTNSSGWTSTNWTGSYNSFTHNTGNTSALSWPVPGIAANQYYQVIITITGMSAGSITYSIGGTTVTFPTWLSMNANGVYTSAPQTIDTTAFLVTPTSTFNGTVAVSIQLVTPASASTINMKDSAGNLIQSLSQSAAVHQNIGMFTPTTLSPYTGNGFGTLITNGSYNTSFGPNCPLCSNTSGTYGTAIGGGVLRNNTTGWAGIAKTKYNWQCTTTKTDFAAAYFAVPL